MATVERPAEKPIIELNSAVVRFCGDSGDGMQLAGTQLTNTSALMGNDIATFPDYPAEIRAPRGTLAGVSGFQVHFAGSEIFTPGDTVDALVAMNPAALQTNLVDLAHGGILIVDKDSLDKKGLAMAGYTISPLDDGSLAKYQVFPVEITRLNRLAVEGLGLSQKEMDRSRNFFAMGLIFWLYDRPLDATLGFIRDKFAKKRPTVAEANTRALKAGYNYGEITDSFASHFRVSKAKLAPGLYRSIEGNQALAFGLLAAAQRSKCELFLGSYPITPASPLLHELSMHKNFGVRTFQAEDEIAAMTSVVGAAFGGAMAVTSTSGPGVSLKLEAIGLAVMLELPMLVINVQRGGPSTGLPTKTEQADLLQAMFGRNGESPIPIVAPYSPADCFNIAQEAWELAVKYMTPVMILSDGYIANGAEPWLIPDANTLPPIEVKHPTTPNGPDGQYLPYLRDARLARPWAVPGTPGLEHRIGGLEKEDVTGNINYEPENHEHMVHTRAKKVALMANDIPELVVDGPPTGDLLVVGWGGTQGALSTAVRQARNSGLSVAHVHLRHLNPFPKNLESLLKSYKRVLIPELNMGQLCLLIRAKFMVDAIGYSKVQGKPFSVSELVAKIRSVIAGESHGSANGNGNGNGHNAH